MCLFFFCLFFVSFFRFVQSLSVYQFGEETVLGDEFVVSALFHDLAFIQDQNPVTVADRETCFWVLLSKAEVASSKMRTLGFGAIALAIIRRCF